MEGLQPSNLRSRYTFFKRIQYSTLIQDVWRHYLIIAWLWQNLPFITPVIEGLQLYNLDTKYMDLIGVHRALLQRFWWRHYLIVTWSTYGGSRNICAMGGLCSSTWMLETSLISCYYWFAKVNIKWSLNISKCVEHKTELTLMPVIFVYNWILWWWFICPNISLKTLMSLKLLTPDNDDRLTSFPLNE